MDRTASKSRLLSRRRCLRAALAAGVIALRPAWIGPAVALAEAPTTASGRPSAALLRRAPRMPAQLSPDAIGAATADRPGAIASGAADAIVLKVGRSGGIGGILAHAALARTTRADVLLASTWDGPLGVAAAVHAAAALRLRDASGLATLPQFDPEALDAVEIAGETLGALAARLMARDGMIVVPQTHGLV